MSSSKPEVTSGSFQRSNTLDVLRGIAVILVIFHHIKLINKDVFVNPVLKGLRYSLTPLVRGGWVGVDLFFILSGFLVSGLLFNEFKQTGGVRTGRFLIRRGFKIYPPLIVFLVLAFLLERLYSYYDASSYFHVWDYLKDLFFLENYLGGRFTHTWSLDVEEFFYLFLTAFFIIAARLRRINFKTFATAYFILLATSVLGRLLSLSLSATDNSFYLKTHTRLDALFFGVFIAYIHHFEKKRFDVIRRNGRMLAVLACVLLVPNFWFGWSYPPLLAVTLTLNSWCFGVLLILSLNKTNWLFRSRPLAFIGRNSYSIYLWHVFINIYLLKIILHTEWDGVNGTIVSIPLWLLYLSLYFVLSVLVGALFTHIVEVPLLRLRDRYFPSTNKRAVVTASDGFLQKPLAVSAGT